MPKRLVLIAMEGPGKQMDDSENAVNMVIKNRFSDIVFKLMSYDPDYPEEATYHVGQTMKFITNSRFVPNGGGQPFEEPTEEEKGIKATMAKIFEASKPHLKQFAKEVWYSKKQLAEMKEEEKARKQRELDGSPEPLEKKKIEGRISSGSQKLS